MTFIAFGDCGQRLDISMCFGEEVNPQIDGATLEGSKYVSMMPLWDQGDHIIPKSIVIIIVFGHCQQRLDISIHYGVELEVNPHLDRGF